MRQQLPSRRIALITALGAALALPGGRALAAEGCANESLRVGLSADLHDCRAYERITPSFKAGFDFRVRGLAGDGSRIFAQGLGAIAGAEGGFEGGALGTTYELTRSEDGWHAKPLSPPVTQFPGQFYLAGEPLKGLSLWDLHTPQQSQYSHTFYLRKASGEFVAIGPLWSAAASAGPPSDASTELRSTRLVGTTEDFNHVVFEVQTTYFNGRRLLFPGDGSLEPSLYQYSGTGNSEPSLVGVTGGRGSTALISVCGTSFGGIGSKYNAISRDGETVFFTPRPGECHGENEAGENGVSGSGPAVAEIYARIDSASTLDISEPPLNLPGRVCTGECAEAEREENGHARGEAIFQGASEDGTKVYFITSQPLVDADTNSAPDLYEAVIRNGSVAGLNLISSPILPEAAQVLGVARISADGSTVYFVAGGVLAANAGAAVDPKTGVAQHAMPGEANLYVYREGHVRFVGTLSEGDSADWQSEDERPVQATPDGRYLLFLSRAQLTLGDESSEAAPQLFEYDAVNDELARISVGEEGYADNGNIASFTNGTAQSTYRRTIRTSITEGAFAYEFARRARDGAKNMSDDGSTVVFNSSAQLTPTATAAAHGCSAVYEYRSDGGISDGTVHLVSDGQDVQQNLEECGARFEAMDASGANVLFNTADQLVGEDTDTQRDIYDARVDGGFAMTTAPESCEGDACRGPLALAPLLSAPASVTQSPGQGVAPRAAKAVVKPRLKTLKACRRQAGKKRALCEARARKKPGSKRRAKTSTSAGGSK